MAERFASVSEDELCEKIKQLLNSVFARYHAQPHAIIVYSYKEEKVFRKFSSMMLRIS